MSPEVSSPGGRAPRPSSVRLAVLALAAATGSVALLAAGAPRPPAPSRIAFAALLGGALLGGLLLRSRLAWLFGRSLALLLAALQAGAVAVGLWQGASFAPRTWILLGAAVCFLVAAFFLLGRPSALGWFGLVCPACLTPSRTAGDLLFRRVHCRRCGNEW